MQSILRVTSSLLNALLNQRSHPCNPIARGSTQVLAVRKLCQRDPLPHRAIRGARSLRSRKSWAADPSPLQADRQVNRWWPPTSCRSRYVLLRERLLFEHSENVQRQDVPDARPRHCAPGREPLAQDPLGVTHRVEDYPEGDWSLCIRGRLEDEARITEAVQGQARARRACRYGHLVGKNQHTAEGPLERLRGSKLAIYKRCTDPRFQPTLLQSLR